MPLFAFQQSCYKRINPCSEFVIPRLAWNRLVYRHCKDTWNQEVYLTDFFHFNPFRTHLPKPQSPPDKLFW